MVSIFHIKVYEAARTLLEELAELSGLEDTVLKNASYGMHSATASNDLLAISASWDPNGAGKVCIKWDDADRAAITPFWDDRCSEAVFEYRRDVFRAYLENLWDEEIPDFPSCSTPEEVLTHLLAD